MRQTWRGDCTHAYTHLPLQCQHGLSSIIARRSRQLATKESIAPLIYVPSSIDTRSVRSVHRQVAQRHVLEERSHRWRTDLRRIRRIRGDNTRPICETAVSWRGGGGGGGGGGRSANQEGVDVTVPVRAPNQQPERVLVPVPVYAHPLHGRYTFAGGKRIRIVMDGSFYEFLARNCGCGHSCEGRSYHGRTSGESI
jgi:hypothetical protein